MYKDCIIDLCIAIVEQAADEYREDYRSYLENPNPSLANYIRLKRDYFEKDCYGLTGMGDYIVERIEREVREGFSEELLIRADKVFSERYVYESRDRGVA